MSLRLPRAFSAPFLINIMWLSAWLVPPFAQAQQPPPTTPPAVQQGPAQNPVILPAPVSTPLATPTPNPQPPVFTPSEVESYLPEQALENAARAVLKTSFGDITIRLFNAEAPQTVANFIALAQGHREFTDVKTGRKVKRPFYNGLIFHRTIPGVLIQTGCPFGNGRGGPGYTVADEISSASKFNKPGLVAMAPQRESDKPKPNSAGSQFFISLSQQPEWDDQFTVFGEVIKGLDVVHKIASAKAGPTDRPIKRIYLKSVVIEQ